MTGSTGKKLLRREEGRRLFHPLALHFKTLDIQLVRKSSERGGERERERESGEETGRAEKVRLKRKEELVGKEGTKREESGSD